MSRMTRRRVLATGSAAAAVALVPGLAQAKRRVILNDASRLNPTPVYQHWIAAANEEATLVERLRQELKDAAAAKRPVSVGAARHSMGGQSIPRNGHAMTLNVPRIDIDSSRKHARIAGGTRWSQVIDALDPKGLSPAVMQSNHDFGVAATFSVNAHGWPVPYGPMGSTVRSFRMMLADGSIVTCSPTENAELFGLAMGGYGLFGIILDLDVEITDNVLLAPTSQVMPSKAFAPAFVKAVTGDPQVRMAYGRLNVARRGFMSEALMVTFRPVPTPSTGLPTATRGGGFISGLTRRVYRAQVGSEAAKRARWLAETKTAPDASDTYTRNRLMNEPVSNLAQSDMSRTDILHEYFVAPERFADFVTACQEIIPKSGQEFLNVTLRYVAADPTSVLSFAPVPRIAAVMSFSQRVTPEGEAGMLRMTEALIDRVADIGGAFYLPYRLHARLDQVAKIYPNAARFADRKRHYDPNLLFRNAMWPAYFAA